ncbi:MAG: hypothetical protein CMJ46_05470 [Planctomyces sp.]|nr:hypothetical protein [Planctomyces sp.]
MFSETNSTEDQNSQVEQPEASNPVQRESAHYVPTSAEVGERIEHLLDATEQLTASWSKSFHHYDQRRDHRIPHEADLLLVPVADQDEMPNGDPGLVLCKDVSNNGFAFYHQKPIVHRKVAILLPFTPKRQELMLAKLVWCRFTQHNFYCSGARVLRKASFPFDKRWTEMELSQW